MSITSKYFTYNIKNICNGIYFKYGNQIHNIVIGNKEDIENMIIYLSWDKYDNRIGRTEFNYFNKILEISTYEGCKPSSLIINTFFVKIENENDIKLIFDDLLNIKKQIIIYEEIESYHSIPHGALYDHDIEDRKQELIYLKNKLVF